TSTRSRPCATALRRLPTARSWRSGRCRPCWRPIIPGSGPIFTVHVRRCSISRRNKGQVMETRAPYIAVGGFVLAAIVAVFGFVYWLNNSGGIGKRDTYHLVFNSPVPGLLVGAGVLFNGIRVGEVTSLKLVADRPHEIDATIAVAEGTPVRADTKVGLDFQVLTGVPVVSLEGGDSADAPQVTGPLVAEKDAGQSMTQAARDALRRVDKVLSDNAAPLHDAIGN